MYMVHVMYQLIFIPYNSRYLAFYRKCFETGTATTFYWLTVVRESASCLNLARHELILDLVDLRLGGVDHCTLWPDATDAQDRM